jgi:release factor glutamine methyltransferase
LLDDIPESVVKKTIKIVNRHKKGVPLAYLLGSSYFGGRRFFITKDVLVPRPDTEYLLERAEKRVIEDIISRKDKSLYKILDLCTGSGCIGISLWYLCDWLHERNKADRFKLVLSDVSINALATAGVNSELHEADADLVESDLFSNIYGRFNLIVCNPPYLKTNEIGMEDKYVLKEPKIALDGGLDGLYFYRRILENAYDSLKDGGTIMFEIDPSQDFDVVKIARLYGFKNTDIYKDLAGRSRVVTISR